MSKIDKIIERGDGCASGSDLTPLHSPELTRLRDVINCIDRRCWGCPCNIKETIRIIRSVEKIDV